MLAAALLAIPLLAACVNGQPIPLAANLKTLWGSSGATGHLNPKYGYMRVTVNGREIMLILGFRDKEPGGGVLDTWYSSAHEVIQLRDGRIAATAGLPTDWRAVREEGAPRWGDLPPFAAAPAVSDASNANASNNAGKDAGAYTYTREHDQMPGYRFGVRESVRLYAIDAPGSSALKDLDPMQLQWFAEDARALTPGAPQLPPARYALRRSGTTLRVEYGEQCLAPDFCLTWQRWPAPREAPPA